MPCWVTSLNVSLLSDTAVTAVLGRDVNSPTDRGLLNVWVIEKE
jgi:hypothetical protein